MRLDFRTARGRSRANHPRRSCSTSGKCVATACRVSVSWVAMVCGNCSELTSKSKKGWSEKIGGSTTHNQTRLHLLVLPFTTTTTHTHTRHPVHRLLCMTDRNACVWRKHVCDKGCKVRLCSDDTKHWSKQPAGQASHRARDATSRSSDTCITYTSISQW